MSLNILPQPIYIYGSFPSVSYSYLLKDRPGESASGENQGRAIGKGRKNLGRTQGEPQENQGRTMGEPADDKVSIEGEPAPTEGQYGTKREPREGGPLSRHGAPGELSWLGLCRWSEQGRAGQG